MARTLFFTLLLPATLFAGAVDSLWFADFRGDSQRYLNRAADVAIDTLNNAVYVCGSIENSTPGQLGSDMGLVKYDLAGQLAWKATLGGNTWSESDMAHALALDSTGNVFIAGVTYNSSPATRYDDYTYAKYSPSGTRLWFKKSALNDDDVFYDIALGRSGELYMCGTRYDSARGLSAFLIVRADAQSGDTVWTRSYVLDTLARAARRQTREAYPEIFDDYSLWDNCATALAVTPTGDVVVTGFGLDYQNELELETWTMKFSPDGTRLWDQTYHHPTTIYHDDDAAFDIAVNRTGDIYIAGFDYFETGADWQDYNYSVVRYNAAGTRLEFRSINVGAEDGADFATALALDDSSSQNIYVTGMLAYPAPLNEQMATFKFGPDLSYRWGPAGALYGGNSDDIGYDITYRRGRVYCVGRRGMDLAAVGYTADNIQPKDTLWTWTYNGAANLEDFAAAVAVKDTSCIIVAGESQQSSAPTWSSIALTRLFYSRLDLALTNLYEPGASVRLGDTVTPRAQVRNLGNRAVGYRVFLRIGGVYTDSVVGPGLLQPGDSAAVTFRDWVANQAGSFATRCSVALAGDVNPANNYINRTVNVNLRDVGARRIIAPFGAVPVGAVLRPIAMVYNYGSSTESTDVNFRISDGYQQRVSVTLRAGDSAAVDFPDWNASLPGVWAVTCSTRMPGDENAANDKASGTVRVALNSDAGVLTVIAPVGTVDSGAVVTPEATVANHGLQPASFEVEFSIQPVYFASTQVDELQPGDSVRVTFDDFVADRPGNYRSLCRTNLPGDENPANDTLSAALTVRGSGGPGNDVGVTVIRSPGAQVDSGTLVMPQVMVRNYTSNAVQAPVHFLIHQQSRAKDAPGRLAGKRIGTDQLYHDSTTVLLGPDQEIPVNFSEWIASPAETLDLQAYTALDGDVNPANDTQLGQTVVLPPPQGSDVGAIAIVAPADTVDSGATVTPTLRVKNFGTTTETFPVRFEISDGYFDETSIMLDPGASVDVTFTQWEAVQAGAFTKRGWTALEGDANPANDTLAGSVYVRGAGQVHDVGSVAIVAPPDTVDSGAVLNPTLRVKNFGTQSETFQVGFSIDDGYSDQTEIVLDPGASIEVTFSQWEAAQSGTYTKRGWTALAGDQNPANDTLTGRVTVRGGAGPTRDVGAVTIVAPPDTVDSGEIIRPVVRVRNFGAGVEMIPVRFQIEDGYFDQTDIVLGPGGTQDVVFGPWTAGQSGTFAMSGWTQLEGDENPSNDTITGTVTVLPGTGIEELAPLPVAFAASRPLPNPTNGRTTVRLALPQPGAVSLRVFDACGQLIATPVQARLGAGRHQLTWDGRDNSGRPVAPGTYYLRVEAGVERSLSRVTILAR